MLFGIPDKKDPLATRAYAKDGIVQKATRALKDKIPDLNVITDVCLCQYTDHGHCGFVDGHIIDNDATLDLLARTALSHAKAGADMVAPSDMMDGRVAEIRTILDENDLSNIPIMSPDVSNGPRQCPGGHSGSEHGHRRRSGYHHGKTGPSLS